MVFANPTTTDTQFLTSLQNVSTPDFSLQSLPGFPFEDYQKLISKYNEMERWYNGTVLDETRTHERTKKPLDVYPVKVNPLIGVVQKHAFALFGEVPDNDQPLVSPKITSYKEEVDEFADHVKDVLAQIWWENHGRSLQWEQGGTTQIYGGCVFELVYDPKDNLLTVPIRIDRVHPKHFIGIPVGGDMWTLKEAWVITPVSRDEALEHGYPIDKPEPKDQKYFLVKHYTTSYISYTINEFPASRQVIGEDPTPLSGENLWGFVPVVYIPHIRINGFWGENVFDHIKGLVRELNLRVADAGDAVSIDSHSTIAMGDAVSGNIDVISPTRGMNILTYSSNPSIVGNEIEAKVDVLNTTSISQTTLELVEWLFSQIQRDTFTPPVAYGEDEGSQRSGLTLAMRMLSLLWHIYSERAFWTTGLNLLARMMLKMLFVKKKEGITKEHLKVRLTQDWSPVLPRDREMVVNEAVARATAHITSWETLFELLGDIPDKELEVKQIIENIKQIAKAEAEAKPPAPPPGRSGATAKKTTED